MPQLVGRHFKIKRVDNLGIVLLAGSQDWLNRVLDTLPIHILIIGALLGGADNNVLPYPLELRVRQRLTFAVGNYKVRLRDGLRVTQAIG